MKYCDFTEPSLSLIYNELSHIVLHDPSTEKQVDCESAQTESFGKILKRTIPQ